MVEQVFARPRDVRNAWIVWLVFFIVISVIVASPSNRRTVVPAYRTASINWFQGQDIYGEGIHGYLYLPQACILFSPLARLPFPVAEVTWRALCIGLLAVAVFRLARLGGKEGGWEFFPLRTVLVIPVAMNSARNGQMNLPWAALMALAAVSLAERKWSWSAFWLSLGLALKPLMLVMILLAAALYKPMRWRLALGAAAVLAFPFLTQHSAYVWEQYGAYLQKMRVAGNPGEAHRFSDLFGLFSSLGIHASSALQTVVRAAAALGALLLCRLALQKRDHVRGTILLLCFTACYLMLFNPRTENNTYVVVGVPLALLGAEAILVNRSRLSAALFPAMVIGMTAGYEISRGPNYWMSPLSCLVFLGYCCVLLFRGSEPARAVATR